jgi:hypothetical protein
MCNTEGCSKLLLNCCAELGGSIIIVLIARKKLFRTKYLKRVRADDSNLVSSCCQGFHDGLERQLMTDGRCGEDSQNASTVGAAHCIQQQ